VSTPAAVTSGDANHCDKGRLRRVHCSRTTIHHGNVRVYCRSHQ